MSQLKYSVATWMTPHNTIFQDISQIAGSGADGIGIWEGKYERRDEPNVISAVSGSGLRATFCMPTLWTILPGPVDGPAMREPSVRTELICESIPHLAKFDPVAIVVGPGTSGDEARPAGPLEEVAKSLMKIADVAADHGQRIAFELLARRRGCPLPTLHEMVDFIDSLDRDNIDVAFDVWHTWAEPSLTEDLSRYVDRIASVQVNDVQWNERCWCDRALPGGGRGVLPGILATLISAGYEGWYELEIVSDDGSYGTVLPDSLWNLPHETLLSLGKSAFDKAYAQGMSQAAKGEAQSRN